MTPERRLPATPLRVLYVQPSDLFGGEERHLVTTVPLLAAHGIDALPLVGPSRTIVEWLSERGVHDVAFSPEFPGNWQPLHGIRRIGLPWRYRRSRDRVAAVITELVRDHGIDLIYASMPFAWAAATPVARRMGVPIVWRAGGPVYLAGRLLGSAVLAPWAMLHPPDLLICSSEMVRGTFAGVVPAPRVAVLNGVDAAHLDPAVVSGAPQQADEMTVGFAGRLVARKGIEDLIAVAGRMARSHARVRFVIAGDGNRRARYEALARAVGAERNVRFAGFVADMRCFYAECDVVVLPSYSEGASMVVLEAMAMRCAVVASDIPSLRELIRPGEDGIIVGAGDRRGLEAALIRLYGDRECRQTLGSAARARVCERFSAEVVSARIAALLHDVAREKGGHR
jgi:glycosyltransferase involved in cell wall biosynthesis